MFNLHDQLVRLQNEEPEIGHRYDFVGTDSAAVKRKLNALTDLLVESCEAINDAETFDLLQSFASDLTKLDSKVVARGIDAVIAGFENEVGLIAKAQREGTNIEAATHSEILDRYAYILQRIVDAVESEARSGQSQAGNTTTKRRRGAGKRIESGTLVSETIHGWDNKISELFTAVHELFKLRLARMWRSTPELDSFLEVFTRMANRLLENPAYLKNAQLQDQIFHVFCVCIDSYNKLYNIATIVTQDIQHYDHLADPLAVLLKICSESYGTPQLADEVLRVMANKEFSTVHDKSGPKNLVGFLVALSEHSPKAMIRQIGLFAHYLDSDSQLMRSAIIEVIGNLIIYLSEQEQVEMTKNQLIEYFDILEQRFSDIHYLVRAKVLQVCQRLCSIKAKFPKQRPRLVDLVVKRFHDKTSNVRKNAIRALIALIETHPFIMDGGELVIEKLEEQANKVNSELQEITQRVSQKIQSGSASASSTPLASSAPLASTTPPPYGRKQHGDELGSGEDSAEESDEDKDQDNDGSDTEPDSTDNDGDKENAATGGTNVQQQQQQQPGLTAEDAARAMELQMRQRYYRDAMHFVRQIQGAIPTLCDILGSTNKQEVIEAMNFFVVAARYRIDGAWAGIRRMSHLIWQTTTNNANEESKGVRSKLIDTYYQLYLTPDPRITDQENTNHIARNLITLTFNATLAELTSLEELLRIMMIEGYISNNVIRKLRSVYGYTKKNIPGPQRRGAILVLSMLAKAQPTVVTDDIDLYLRVGLGPHGHEDLLLAKYTCQALQSLVGGSNVHVRGVEEGETKRLPMNSPIFERLAQILRLEKRDPKWFPVAEQVLNTIYCLGDKPSELVTAIIKEQTRKVLDVIRVTVEGGSGPESEVANPGGKTGSGDAMQIEEVEDNSSDVGGEAVVVDIPAKTTMVDSWELTKLLFMIGHVAIKEIVLLELVESNLKAQKARTESERRARPVSRDEEEEEELNQVAGSAEDDIGDAIASIRERELLYGGTSLLAHFAPLVVHVCSNPSLYSDPTLQVHAITALTKLMCISVSFCEKHLPLLLSILRRSKSPVIRSNIAIALGDVTVCFSNLMGENVQYLYEPLRDDDLKVKRSMLMVLTHLILNGMIKVKGQLGEMAKCLEDPDPRVVDLAKLFFTELSSKDNAIYNNLPDIISSLSGDREDCVSEVKFGRIMRFLFDFIKDKDKQAENVIEKLCHRYRVTTDPRQWRDIALCLTLLPYKSERSVRRLVDGFSCYQEALADDTVYRHLSDIGTKLRGQSFQKQDAKHVVDEFLIKLSQGRARATGEEVSAKAGMMDVKDSSAATTNTSGLRTALGDMEIYSDDDDL